MPTSGSETQWNKFGFNSDRPTGKGRRWTITPFWVIKTSHFSTYKVKVANVSKQMLIDAITRLAKLQGLQVANTVTGYDGIKRAVDIGLKGQGLAYGIGFSIVNGCLHVHGDSYNSPAWSRIEKLAQQHLIAQKIAVNARTQHSNASIRFKTTQKAVLVEVEM
jgi:hypothetical protein